MQPLRATAGHINPRKQEVAEAESIVAFQRARQSAAHELIAQHAAAEAALRSPPSPRDAPPSPRDEQDADVEARPIVFDLNSVERSARPLFGVHEDDPPVWRERQLEAARALCVPGKPLVMAAPTGWGKNALPALGVEASGRRLFVMFVAPRRVVGES